MEMSDIATVIVWITLGFTSVGACALAVHTITQATKASLRRRRLARQALAAAGYAIISKEEIERIRATSSADA
jgi:hypothetical protein